jgi:cytochrome P450
MPTHARTRRAGPPGAAKATRIPLRRTVPGLVRNPFKAYEGIGRQANGEIVRLDLGLFRPYLITHPDHVQRVLRDRGPNYVRDGDGMFWSPVRRLLGDGILSEGPAWEASRKVLQPLFTAKRVESLVDRMGEAIAGLVDGLQEHAESARPVDVGVEMNRIVYRTIGTVFFADRIPVRDADRLARALGTYTTAVSFRLLMPYVPNSIPMPGDRAFRRAARTIDEVLLPMARGYLRHPTDGDDVVSALCQARTGDNGELDEQQLRNDLVSVFGTATETSAVVLSWLWPLLDAHPDVTARLYEEIDRVVGSGPVNRSHVADLRYTRMVVDELLRLYPSGWLLPRTAKDADVVDGVLVEPGATVIISPYLTHRLPAFWDDPLAFDPERFAPERKERRHRYSYFPFGGGPHQCLGNHLFMVEAQLIVATLLTRFRFKVLNSTVPTPRVSISLRPRQRIDMTLSARRASIAA